MLSVRMLVRRGSDERTSMAPNKPDLFHIQIREFLIRGTFWDSLPWLIRFATMIKLGAKFRSVLPG
jgi:hypothetical protein